MYAINKTSARLELAAGKLKATKKVVMLDGSGYHGWIGETDHRLKNGRYTVYLTVAPDGETKEPGKGFPIVSAFKEHFAMASE